MKTVQVQIFLTENMFSELQSRSKLENVTQSEMVEQALLEYFDAIEAEHDQFLSPETAIPPGERDPNKH